MSVGDHTAPPYWEREDWAAQRQRNIENLVQAWDHDWGPFYHAVAERCGLTLTEAMLYVVSNKIHWWTEAQQAASKKFERHMETEHGDEDWRAPP